MLRRVLMRALQAAFRVASTRGRRVSPARVLIGPLPECFAAALRGPAGAAAQVLMPNVSYQRTVQFAAHGPVVLNVLTAPRPGGLYQLRPLLSNGAILGTERVTAMQKDISDSATVAGA